MCGVIENEDLGTAYIRFRDRKYHTVAPYTLCAKTGTAQTGRYPNAWFVTYAPAENPQIATVVMVPQSLEGSQVSAPITRRILDYYFRVADNQYADYPEWWAEAPYDPLKSPEGGSGR
jgi:penicillin-binding protein 2